MINTLSWISQQSDQQQLSLKSHRHDAEITAHEEVKIVLLLDHAVVAGVQGHRLVDVDRRVEEDRQEGGDEDRRRHLTLSLTTMCSHVTVRSGLGR